MKKDLILAVLVTSCVASILFLALPIRSTATSGEYDPWIDTNDDGIINYKDLFNLATTYGALGTPINKTDLLLDLQDSLDSLNASLVELQSTIETLEARLETRIDLLNATVANLLSHNETYSTTLADISWYPALNWQNMTDMSIDITLATDSTLLIMFSAQACVTGGLREMYVRAMVDSTQANPPTELILMESAEWASHSYTFYSPNVSKGTHTVNIQWKLNDELSVGRVMERTLTVLALPAL